MDNTIEISVPISVGELFDKITILKIKSEKINDPRKLANITKELNILEKISNAVDQYPICKYVRLLEDVNRSLWEIEDKKRYKEKVKIFDEEFIQLSRMVYINNDKRAEIKKQINLATNSLIIEEKSYE